MNISEKCDPAIIEQKHRETLERLSRYDKPLLVDEAEGRRILREPGATLAQLEEVLVRCEKLREEAGKQIIARMPVCDQKISLANPEGGILTLSTRLFPAFKVAFLVPSLATEAMNAIFTAGVSNTELSTLLRQIPLWEIEMRSHVASYILKQAPEPAHLEAIIEYVPEAGEAAARMLLSMEPSNRQLLAIIRHVLEYREIAAKRLLSRKPDREALIAIVMRVPALADEAAAMLIAKRIFRPRATFLDLLRIMHIVEAQRDMAWNVLIARRPSIGQLEVVLVWVPAFTERAALEILNLNPTREQLDRLIMKTEKKFPVIAERARIKRVSVADAPDYKKVFVPKHA